MKIIRLMTINDAALVSSNVTEDDYAAYNAGTTYALGDRAIYVAADVHWVIESLQNANTGHTPTGATTDTWWLLVGKTNRWKMFDGSIQSQTSNADTIEATFTSSSQLINSVVLYNVSAATARVQVTDATDGLVYDQTVDLVSDSGITDPYSYCFEPIVRKPDVMFTGLPPYLNAEITVTLTDTGNTVLCGACVAGLAREIGVTKVGALVGIQDYSIKQRDDFGNYTILERAYSRRANFNVIIENSLIDELQTVLAGYRATAAVYLGDEKYQSSNIYGFYKDFSTVIDYGTYSILSIELESLT